MKCEVKNEPSALAGAGLGARCVVQTNPIPAPVPIGRSAFPGGQIVQNEPNSQRADMPLHSNIPFFQRSSPMPTMRNEPNSAGLGQVQARKSERCETNPISAGDGWDEATGAGGHGAIVRNEPNLRLAPWHGHPFGFALRAGFAREGRSSAGCRCHDTA